MYRWWALLHIFGVAGFLLSHGVSVSVGMRLRKVRNREHVLALMRLSGSTITAMYASLAMLLAGGFGAAITGLYWGKKWITWAIVVLVLTTAAMLAMARPYYRRLNEKLRVRETGVPMASDEEIDEILSSSRPLIVAWIGYLGLGIILWLMVFKPS